MIIDFKTEEYIYMVGGCFEHRWAKEERAGIVQIVQIVDGKQELGRKEGEGCTTPYTI